MTQNRKSGPFAASNAESVRKPVIQESLVDCTRKAMSEVNTIIFEQAHSHVALVGQVADHLISSGGKRIRPMMTIACAEACGYQGVDHLRLAASVEFLHTATLLHDDVVDGSSTRRGSVCARTLWGNPSSVLVGDFLLGKAFCLMVQTGNLTALDILSRAAARIAEGEVRQLSLSDRLEFDLQACFRVVEAKTAVLFSAAAEVGPAIAGVSGSVRESARRFGHCFGMAYQLTDDILDYLGNTETMGKQVGDDLREGKITIPVILSFNQSTLSERIRWRDVFSGRMADEDRFLAALELIKSHGVGESVRTLCEQYLDEAKEVLLGLPAGNMRDALEAAATGCRTRVS